MSGQWGDTRKYTTVKEGVSKVTTRCRQCNVYTVSRGIADSRFDAKGEHHCPNCGHIYGRDSLVGDPHAFEVMFVVLGAGSEPLEGAIVTFGDETTTTNEDGVAIFIKPEGVYDWSVSAEGYVTQTDEEYTLDADAMAEMPIEITMAYE